MHVALHERAAVVVLDVAQVVGLGHGDGLVEALLLEVADRVVVRVRQEVEDAALDGAILQVVHEARPEAAHLLARRDRALKSS